MAQNLNANDPYRDLTADIIGAAIEVHRTFGPGLLESIYEAALIRELELRGHSVRQQSRVQIIYKGFTFEQTLRSDLIVDECVLVENKAVEKIIPRFQAQVLSYMRLLKIKAGLIFNYHEEKLVDGLCRLSLDKIKSNENLDTKILNSQNTTESVSTLSAPSC